MLIRWWKKETRCTTYCTTPLIILIIWQETLTTFQKAQSHLLNTVTISEVRMIIVHQSVHSNLFSSGAMSDPPSSRSFHLLTFLRSNGLRELEDAPQMQLAIGKKMAVIRPTLFWDSGQNHL